MSRRAAALAILAAASSSALAQMPETPGPGGVPLAPGRPVPGYTPGGIGPGGIEVAPGPAARGVPMYRIGPGGVLLPPRPDPHPDGNNATVRLDPGVPQAGHQSLVLTIHSRDAAPAAAPAPDASIDSIDALFAALRACWEPPAREQAREGFEMSVRFSLKRNGALVGAPFVTYSTPGGQPETRQVYREAITAALDRCAPIPFSKGFGAAIVGKPLSIRYVDDRVMSAESRGP